MATEARWLVDLIVQLITFIVPHFYLAMLCCGTLDKLFKIRNALLTHFFLFYQNELFHGFSWNRFITYMSRADISNYYRNIDIYLQNRPEAYFLMLIYIQPGSIAIDMSFYLRVCCHPSHCQTVPNANAETPLCNYVNWFGWSYDHTWGGEEGPHMAEIWSRDTWTASKKYMN